MKISQAAATAGDRALVSDRGLNRGHSYIASFVGSLSPYHPGN
jgi:hypothetical protein